MKNNSAGVVTVVGGPLLVGRFGALTSTSSPLISGLAAERSGSGAGQKVKWAERIGDRGSKNQMERERSRSGRSSERERSGERACRKWSWAMSGKFSAPLRSHALVRIRRKFVILLSLKISPHHKYVATLPCEMSVLKSNKWKQDNFCNNTF